MSEVESSPSNSTGHVGLITDINNNDAFVWIIETASEVQLDISKTENEAKIGDWIEISLCDDGQPMGAFKKIEPFRETRISEMGYLQVKTIVVFDTDDKVEQAAHGRIALSPDFGRIAYFPPFPTRIAGLIYEAFVERMPVEQADIAKKMKASWFLPLDDPCRPSLPFSRLSPSKIRKFKSSEWEKGTTESSNVCTIDKGDNTELNKYTGVVVSKDGRCAYIWTPQLGEGICESGQSLEIGDWISFSINFPGKVFKNINIRFDVCQWFRAEPILQSIPSRKSITLLSRIYLPEQLKQYGDNLVAYWVGPVLDKDGIFAVSVESRDIRGKTVGVVLQRVKKSKDMPITAWNVCKVLDVIDDPNVSTVCSSHDQSSLTHSDPVPQVSMDNASKQDEVIGIVVSEKDSSVFVWTPSLGEGICPNRGSLKIGDWINFKLKKGTSTFYGNIRFEVAEWKRTRGLFPARRENNTVVIRTQTEIPLSFSTANDYPHAEFVGPVTDRENLFRRNIDRLRGHIVELDVKRVKDLFHKVTVWNIVYIKDLGSSSDVAAENRIDVTSGSEIAVLQPRRTEENEEEIVDGKSHFFNPPANDGFARETGGFAPPNKNEFSCGVHGFAYDSDGFALSPDRFNHDSHAASSSVLNQKIVKNDQSNQAAAELSAGAEEVQKDPFTSLVESVRNLFESDEVRTRIRENNFEDYALICTFLRGKKL